MTFKKPFVQMAALEQIWLHLSINQYQTKIIITNGFAGQNGFKDASNWVRKTGRSHCYGNAGEMMEFLIIDDDIESCQLLEKRLERYGTSVFAADGNTAYHLFLEAHQKLKPFAVIFLDIVMPEIDGHKVLVNIREWEETHLAPEMAAKIVMVSAMKDTKNIFSSVREGCDNYMTKPIRKQGVIDVMQKLGFPDRP